jgi:hypothetical protein
MPSLRFLALDGNMQSVQEAANVVRSGSEGATGCFLAAARGELFLNPER